MPAPVSEKKVLKASSPPPMVLSEGICVQHGAGQGGRLEGWVVHVGRVLLQGGRLLVRLMLLLGCWCSWE